jgi:hypothetical protein
MPSLVRWHMGRPSGEGAAALRSVSYSMLPMSSITFGPVREALSGDTARPGQAGGGDAEAAPLPFAVDCARIVRCMSALLTGFAVRLC